MQIFFTLKEGLESYLKSGKKYDFPSPEIRRCHRCNKFVEFKKHGFYERYLVTTEYSGQIVIRRYMILSILLDTFFSNNLWFLRWYIMGWSVAKSHYIPTRRFAPSLRCFRILSLIKLFSLYHRRKTTIRRTNPAIVPITHEISPY